MHNVLYMMIDGKKIAEDIAEQLRTSPLPKRFMAAVLVGDDKNSISFLARKKAMAESVGVDFRLYEFPADIKNDALREEVGKIAAHKTCGGVIVQLPLPAHLNRHYILNAIPPEKDFEVLGERALGSFYVGRSKVLPPSAATAQEIVERYALKLGTMRAVVVGRGILIGKPVATWLMDKVRDLTVLGEESGVAALSEADLVVSGVGKANLIDPKVLKSGAAVIDFGYDFPGGKIRGDLDMRELENGGALADKLGPWTPTPGGTGPILVAKLFENFYRLNAE